MPTISRRRFVRYTAVGTGAAVFALSQAPFDVNAQAGPEVFRLRILHTNDHHARIEPANADHGGVSRRKTLIDQIRNGSPDDNIILIDAGDVFQGTLWWTLYGGMADMEFYNAMGYEAMTLGNHEFNLGQGPLATFIKAATFPVVSANLRIDPSSPMAGLVKPNTILERGGQRIGIFGLTTPETTILSNPGPGVTFTDPFAAAQEQVAVLRNQGVDRIIALTHLGIDTDRQLAARIFGLDVIVGGHSHTPMGPQVSPPNPSRPYPEIIRGPEGNLVVVVTDWEWGRWLGDITIGFDPDGVVTGVTTQPVEVRLSAVTPDQGFENRIATLGAPLAELRRRVIGQTTTLLDGDRASVRTRETNLGNLVCDAMLEKARPAGAQIAITNGGGIRTSIPAGPVSVGQVFEVLPFGNTLATVDLTGAQVREALENGVSQVNLQTPGNSAGRFPQVGGMRFTWNPDAPAGSRVVDIQIRTDAGFAPIDPAGTYRVVTNNFMLTGGDGYSVFTRGQNQRDLFFVLDDVVRAYITARSPLTVGAEDRITRGTAAAQPATAAPPPAAAPAPVAEPVPAALPNTGGDLPGGWLLTALGAGAIGAGMALRRRKVPAAEAGE